MFYGDSDDDRYKIHLLYEKIQQLQIDVRVLEDAVEEYQKELLYYKTIWQTIEENPTLKVEFERFLVFLKLAKSS
jgi:hypothetical protein